MSKTVDPSLNDLQERMNSLQSWLTTMQNLFYDEKEEQMNIIFPNNSEGRQMKRVYQELFGKLMKIKEELNYFSQPIIDTGVLKYDVDKERYIFKSVGQDLELTVGMQIEILLEDYFMEENQWVVTKLDYRSTASEGTPTHSHGWYISEDKQLPLENAKVRLRGE